MKEFVEAQLKDILVSGLRLMSMNASSIPMTLPVCLERWKS